MAMININQEQAVPHFKALLTEAKFAHILTAFPLVAEPVASGLFFAVNLNQYGEVESRYFDLLAQTCYRRQKMVVGYGLKFWPEDVESLSEELPHLAIFHSGK